MITGKLIVKLDCTVSFALLSFSGVFGGKGTIIAHPHLFGAGATTLRGSVIGLVWSIGFVGIITVFALS
ncbi:hypothetical protein KA405_03785 [Patescibacteria group bacterium]|nr:hypothetical protein [Patescibacteria group bacterium]